MEIFDGYNPKYHEDLEKLRNYDITKSLKKYLDNFYEYYMYYFVDNETPVKKFYHVIRVKGQLEHYLKTGVFNLEMDEKYRKEMIEAIYLSEFYVSIKDFHIGILNKINAGFSAFSYD